MLQVLLLAMRDPDSEPESEPSLQQTDSDGQHQVELWTSSIPRLGFIAEHHWFVINDCGKQSRWEVWQTANVICNDIGESWDHLHRDLLPLTAGMRKGPAWHLNTWQGEQARYLIERIRTSPQHYPWCSKYRYWPGPNSNTYVQWILLGQYTLGRKGVGRLYCHLAPRETLV